MAETIQVISQDEFERHGAARAPAMLLLMGSFLREIEYFKALDGWYLGVLIHYREDDDYGYAVLGPDERGSKRWIGGQDSIPKQSDARMQLLEALAEFAAGGRRIHRQD